MIANERIDYLKSRNDFRLKENDTVYNQAGDGPNFCEAVTALVELLDDFENRTRIDENNPLHRGVNEFLLFDKETLDKMLISMEDENKNALIKNLLNHIRSV